MGKKVLKSEESFKFVLKACSTCTIVAAVNTFDVYEPFIHENESKSVISIFGACYLNEKQKKIC